MIAGRASFISSAVLGALALATCVPPPALRLVAEGTPERVQIIAPHDLTNVFTFLGVDGRDERNARFRAAMMERAPATPLSGESDPVAAAARLRAELRAMIFDAGVAPTWRAHAPAAPITSFVANRDGYDVFAFQFDPMPDVWVPGVLYVPTDVDGQRPTMLMLSGHSDSTYMDDIQRRAINFAKRGFVVLQLEWFNRGQLAFNRNGHDRLNQLELCGTHALAPFLITLEKAIDVLTQDARVDPARIGVAGLSGGGWQTLWIAALDERVTFANPVAGFCAYEQRASLPQAMGDTEQTPTDLYLHADYTDLVRLVAPRPLLLTYNTEDEYFPADPCLDDLEGPAQSHYAHVGAAGALRSFVSDFPGNHVMQTQAREALHEFARDVVGFEDDVVHGIDDLDVDNELLSVGALRRTLPSPNRTLHLLAHEACAELPHNPALPTQDGLALWQTERRAQLSDLLRLHFEGLPQLTLRAAGDGPARELIELHDVSAAGVRVPYVLVSPVGAERVVLLLDDAGRGASTARADELASHGVGVVVMDPSHVGTSQVGNREWLYALMVAATGNRPLGVQAAQVLAAARQVAERTRLPVHIEARGPRMSALALVAAALEPETIEAVILSGSLVSLHDAIEQDLSFWDVPELYTFGLLEQFDLLQLVALASPATIVVTDDDGRFADAWASALSLGR